MHRRSVREAIGTRRAQFPDGSSLLPYQCDNVRGFQTPPIASRRLPNHLDQALAYLHRLRQRAQLAARRPASPAWSNARQRAPLIRWRRTGPRTSSRARLRRRLPRNYFPIELLCTARGWGEQLHERNQCARNFVVRFATLHRSSIRRGKRIAWCAMAAGRFSQHAANSVSFLQNALTSRPADASGALYLESNLARPNAALFPHRSRRMIRIRRISRVCRRPAPSDSGKQDFHKPSNRAR